MTPLPRLHWSTLGEATRDADARAFAALMGHIRQVDAAQHTVLMMQVENEVGVVGDSRDRSPAANAAFAGPVPAELMDYLQKHKAALAPEFSKVWAASDFKTSGTWEEVFGTGAGTALLGGALLGLIIGTVIVAQTIYSSTKDHLSEFATLRALGSSSGYIHKVILAQAGLSAAAGYGLGIGLSLVIAQFSGETALPVVFTPVLAAFLFAITLIMCVVSALSSILKVTKIDPASVFAR